MRKLEQANLPLSITSHTCEFCSRKFEVIALNLAESIQADGIVNQMVDNHVNRNHSTEWSPSNVKNNFNRARSEKAEAEK